jgi:DNA repair protein RadC
MEGNNILQVAEISISYSPMVKSEDRVKIRSSSDAERVLRSVFPSLSHREYFYLLLLDRSSHCLGFSQVSMGGIAGTVADIRIIFQTAIKANCSGIILAHNHASGNLSPSDADIRLTRKVSDAGTLLDISVMDHLILAESGYYSFADESQL